VSVAEAARLLGISETLAYELIGRGSIPAVRLGRRLGVPQAWLGELVRRACDSARSIGDEEGIGWTSATAGESRQTAALSTGGRAVVGDPRSRAARGRTSLAPPRLRPVG
jgi:excisionase family DNA binding protein